MSLFLENNQDLPEPSSRRLPGKGSRMRRTQKFLEDKNQSLQDANRRRLFAKFEHGYFDNSEVECMVEQKDVEVISVEIDFRNDYVEKVVDVSSVLEEFNSVPDYELGWLYCGLSNDYSPPEEHVELKKDSFALIQSVMILFEHLKVEEYGIHYNDAVLTTVLCTILQSHHHYSCHSCSNDQLHSSLNPIHEYVRQFGNFGSVSIRPENVLSTYQLAKDCLYRRDKFNGQLFSLQIKPYLKNYHLNAVGNEVKPFFDLYRTIQTIFKSGNNRGSNGVGLWTADYYSVRSILPIVNRINWNDAIMAYYFDTFSTNFVKKPYDDSFYIKVNCNLLNKIHKKLSYFIDDNYSVCDFVNY
jgi:hypothetical protein